MEDKAKYTPGPWKFETVKTQVGSCHKVGPLGKYRDGRDMHACIYVDGYVWPDVLPRTEEGRVSIANASLIAAAPDLLEALKALLAAVKESGQMNNLDKYVHLGIQVNNAIAKAEGH